MAENRARLPLWFTNCDGETARSPYQSFFINFCKCIDIMLKE